MNSNMTLSERLVYLDTNQPILKITNTQPERSKVRSWLAFYEQTAKLVIQNASSQVSITNQLEDLDFQLVEEVYLASLRYQQLMKLFDSQENYLKTLYSIIYTQVYYLISSKQENSYKLQVKIGYNLLFCFQHRFRYYLDSACGVDVWNLLLLYSAYILGIPEELANQVVEPISEMKFAKDLMDLQRKLNDSGVKMDESMQISQSVTLADRHNGKLPVIFWEYFSTGCGLMLKGAIMEAQEYFLKFTKLNPTLSSYEINPLNQVITHIKVGNLSNVLKMAQSFHSDFVGFELDLNRAEKKSSFHQNLYNTKRNQLINCVERLQLKQTHRELLIEKSTFQIINQDVFVSQPLSKDERIQFFVLQIQSAIIQSPVTRAMIYTPFYLEYLAVDNQFNEIWLGLILFKHCSLKGKELWIYYFEGLKDQQKMPYIEAILNNAEQEFQANDGVVLNVISVARNLRKLRQYHLSYVMFCFLRKQSISRNNNLQMYLPYMYFQLGKLGIVLGLFRHAKESYFKAKRWALIYKKNDGQAFMTSKSFQMFLATLLIQSIILNLFLDDIPEACRHYQEFMDQVLMFQGKQAIVDKSPPGSRRSLDVEYGMLSHNPIVPYSKDLFSQMLRFFNHVVNLPPSKACNIYEQDLLMMLPRFFANSGAIFNVTDQMIKTAQALEIKEMYLSLDVESKLKPTSFPNMLWRALSMKAKSGHIKRKEGKDNEDSNLQLNWASTEEIPTSFDRKTNKLYLLCFSVLLTRSKFYGINQAYSFIQDLSMHLPKQIIELLVKILRNPKQQKVSYMDLLYKAIFLIELCDTQGTIALLHELSVELIGQSLDQATKQLNNVTCITNQLMGDIYFFLQQFEMAKSYYNKALAYDPKIYSIHFNLGLINKVEERYVASFKHFQACFHAPEYTIPSMYFMYIMVRRSLMIELSKEQLLRQLTTWNTTKPTQEDMKELVAQCNWKVIDKRSTLHDSCILFKSEMVSMTQTSTSDTDNNNDIAIDHEVIVRSNSFLVSRTNDNKYYDQSQVAFVGGVINSNYIVESLYQEKDEMPINNKAGREDIKVLVDMLQEDFSMFPEIRTNLDRIRAMVDDERLLQLDSSDFMRYRHNVKHIQTTDFSNVWQIMLFDVPYASKEINTKVFMRGQRTYQEYEEINLSLEEVCVLYDLLKLDCPGVCKLRYFGFKVQESNDTKHFTFYILTPFQSKGSLQNYQLPTDLLKLQIVIKIAETLEKLHEHNLAHLDLKPSNILLDDEDLSPTLIDFGISKILTQSMRNPTSQYGTIRYCAPEILNGKLSKKADIYSFGCLLYELFTGQHPWQNIKDQWQLTSHIQESARTINTYFQDAHQKQIQDIKFPEIREIICNTTLADSASRCNLQEIQMALNMMIIDL